MDFAQDWQKLYQLAVLETDWSTMEARITATEAAIKQRLSELTRDHGGTPQENLSIVATIQRLNILRGELAVWQNSKDARSEKRQVSE